MSTKHTGSVTAGGIEVELSRPDKVLFGADEITKGDLARYYQDVAARMLQYLAGRPLVMARYPDGITGQRLFQKNVPGYFPDWITRTEVAKQDGTLHQVLCDKPATLVYLANQACIEMHIFTSQVGRLDRPDQVVFDMDPPDAGHFGDACQVALRLRDLLERELGLTAFVKTTGGKGLHVHVPLRAADGFDEVRGFARQAAELLASRNPDLLTTQQRKDGRGSRVYADVMRNAYAQTVVAPFSVRARPGAPVAMPLHWDELTPGLEPGRFTLRTARRLLDERDDPWAGLTAHRYGLAGAAARLSQLSAQRRE
jgi:bifunctional non-homologous end joining protein LigD